MSSTSEGTVVGDEADSDEVHIISSSIVGSASRPQTTPQMPRTPRTPPIPRTESNLRTLGHSLTKRSLSVLSTPTKASISARESITIDLTSDVFTSNLPLTKTIESIALGEGRLRVGKSVELAEGSFLLITRITEDETKKIRIYGHTLRRFGDLNGLFPRTQNELAWVVDADDDDLRPIIEQSIQDTELLDIIRIRNVRFTNESHTCLGWRMGDDMVQSEANDKGRLTVRCKLTTTWPSANIRKSGKCHFPARAIEMLTEHDLKLLCKKHNPGVEERKRVSWRGFTARGGSYVQRLTIHHTSTTSPTKRKRSDLTIDLTGEHFPTFERTLDLTGDCSPKINRTVNLTSDHSTDFGSTRSRTKSSTTFREHATSSIITKKQVRLSTTDKLVKSPETKEQDIRMYTYGDAFCGAGGATRGAVQARLKVAWGLDNDEHAQMSWPANFRGPSTVMHKMDAFDLLQNCSDLDLRCDILHLSPPCQFFSSAHTVAGPNDEKNFSAIFACDKFLDRCKPRMGTLEQTAGLGHVQFRWVFNAVVREFISRGYSIRWKVCFLAKYGLPQRRSRLLMIYAGPGEQLPDFPKYTHADPKYGSQAGLKPFVTLNDVFAEIPRNHPLQNTKQVVQHSPRKPPYSGDNIGPRCITTSGGQNYHPDGWRNLTHAEYAVAQGFPLNHKFSEKCRTKQIGNAYAPSVSRVIFVHIRKALEEIDRKRDGTAENDVEMVERNAKGMDSDIEVEWMGENTQSSAFIDLCHKDSEG